MPQIPQKDISYKPGYMSEESEFALTELYKIERMIYETLDKKAYTSEFNRVETSVIQMEEARKANSKLETKLLQMEASQKQLQKDNNALEAKMLKMEETQKANNTLETKMIEMKATQKQSSNTESRVDELSSKVKELLNKDVDIENKFIKQENESKRMNSVVTTLEARTDGTFKALSDLGSKLDSEDVTNLDTDYKLTIKKSCFG